MKLEITPEPTPDERKAIERALAASPRVPSEWHEAGVRENTRWQGRHPRTFDAGTDYPLESGRGATPQ